MRRAGITVPELIVVVAIIVVVAAVAVPNFLESSKRSPVSRVKTDMRSVAVALEAYHLDNGRYPAWGGEVPTFQMPSEAWRNWTLTTPVTYMTSYPRDPFTDSGRTFSYYTDPQAQGWILWSPGPDRDLDFNGKNIVGLYRAKMDQEAPELLVYAYDPSNGPTSSGDVYRVMRIQEREMLTSTTLQN